MEEYQENQEIERRRLGSIFLKNFSQPSQKLEKPQKPNFL